jgi:hypothetical protein
MTFNHLTFNLAEKSEPEFPHNLDLLGLYRRFISGIYDIYYREHSNTPEGNLAAEEQRERNLKCMKEQHELLALKSLFTEDQVKCPQINYQFTFSVEEFTRVGIVEKDNEGKPQFIHSTFAEYFVAEFILNQLTKETEQHQHVRDLLLNEILLKSDYHVIRAFLDGLSENLIHRNRS